MPEEPNIRVYLRAAMAVVETARGGLSDEGFAQLREMLAAEMKRK